MSAWSSVRSNLGVLGMRTLEVAEQHLDGRNVVGEGPD
jgi:hypothetical protein